MRQSYFKNAALLTGSDVVLRLAGMGLRIWLANALGGAGMGLYQLVLAVYGLFVTLATAGISVAAARLLTEELSRDKAAARGMLVRLVLAGLTLGGLAMVAQLATAGLAAKWWLGDVRAAAALHLGAGAAVDGDLGGAARLFSGAAAGGAQRAQPAGRADGAHCRGGVGAFPHAGLAGRQPLRAGAGGYRPERGRIHRPDGTVLPAGGGTLLRQHSAAPAKGGVPAAVGHPVAGGGRQGAFQRAAHRREYAGARLPCGVSGGLPAGAPLRWSSTAP